MRHRAEASTPDAQGDGPNARRATWAPVSLSCGARARARRRRLGLLQRRRVVDAVAGHRGDVAAEVLVGLGGSRRGMRAAALCARQAPRGRTLNPRLPPALSASANEIKERVAEHSGAEAGGSLPFWGNCRVFHMSMLYYCPAGRPRSAGRNPISDVAKPIRKPKPDRWVLHGPVAGDPPHVRRTKRKAGTTLGAQALQAPTAGIRAPGRGTHSGHGPVTCTPGARSGHETARTTISAPEKPQKQKTSSKPQSNTAMFRRTTLPQIRIPC